MDMKYGQIAYEAYADDRNYTTWDARVMPTWDNLTYEIQNAWRVSANITIVAWQGNRLDGNN